MTLRVKRIRDFCGRLGIEVPLLSAPMTSITTPELVAAVSNAGGLGILAADLMSPEEIISVLSASIFGFLPVTEDIWSRLRKWRMPFPT